VFLEFILHDKKDSKSLTDILEKIEKKIAVLSNRESLDIRLGSSGNVNYDLYEDLVFYRDVLIESFCGSSCVPYPKSKIVAQINSLLYKSC